MVGLLQELEEGPSDCVERPESLTVDMLFNLLSCLGLGICHKNMSTLPGSRYAVCNLSQNPRIMPIVSDKMPTLLRTASNMWLMNLSTHDPRSPTTSNDAPEDIEERHLFPDEALALMGIPVYPDLAASGNFFRFPHSELLHKFSDTAKHELAGNDS